MEINTGVTLWPCIAQTASMGPVPFPRIKISKIRLLRPTHQLLRKMSSSKPQFTLKTPKGTKDWDGKDMVIRQKLFDTITSVFRRHGGVTIDTPVFELRDILTGKYGEDSKLIYNLEDQGGEITSLRYDLTVPFARYVAMNGVQSIKRYHIAKVYRRDQPAMQKGRMREFYQCDFDIAGAFDSMVPDAECLAIAVEIFNQLGLKGFTIKLNHRKILDGIFTFCGVPDEKVRTISSAVDKLDKLPWEEVKKEMTVEKGLAPEVADKIGEYVQLKGTVPEMVAKLEQDKLMENESAKQGVEDMRNLVAYLEAYDIVSNISFDLSLARGLDYYTGLIYEVVTAHSAPPTADAAAEEAPKDPKALKAAKKAKKAKGEDDDNSENVGVGSIAAGGRYDKLVGMFATKKNGDIPCVGISFGVERIFSLLKQAGTFDHLRPTATQVFIMAFGGGPQWNGFLPVRMRIAKLLWDNGIEAEFQYKAKPKLQKQFEAAERSGCPLGVILGQEEFKNGLVKVKTFGLHNQNDQGTDVKVDELVPFLKQQLEQINQATLAERVAQLST